MSIEQDRLAAMQSELDNLLQKQLMVPADSFEATLIAASISKLEQQLNII